VRLSALVLALGLLLSGTAQAGFLFDFWVLADPLDPLLAGQTAHGSFWINDPIGGESQLYDPDPNLYNFSFNWDGQSWGQSDATLWGAADLTNWGIGGAPAGSGALSTTDYDFLISNPVDGVGHFWYTSGPAHSQNASSKPQNPHRKVFAGTLTSWNVSNAADIPEPATLPLLAIGLLVPLALFRRGAPADLHR
jgi:hypothetical protein